MRSLPYCAFGCWLKKKVFQLNCFLIVICDGIKNLRVKYFWTLCSDNKIDNYGKKGARSPKLQKYLVFAHPRDIFKNTGFSKYIVSFTHSIHNCIFCYATKGFYVLYNLYSFFEKFSQKLIKRKDTFAYILVQMCGQCCIHMVFVLFFFVYLCFYNNICLLTFLNILSCLFGKFQIKCSIYEYFMGS